MQRGWGAKHLRLMLMHSDTVRQMGWDPESEMEAGLQLPAAARQVASLPRASSAVNTRPSDESFGGSFPDSFQPRPSR